MRSGSYNDVIPNHYSLGYQMVNYGKEKFGDNVWLKCIKDAASYKGLFWSFSNSLKKQTGLSTKGLYNQMVGKDSIKNSIIPPEISYFYSSELVKNNPTFYNYPMFYSPDEVFVLKSTFDTEPYLVSVDLSEGGEEIKIMPVSYGFGKYDLGEKYVVWSEINKNPR